MKPTTEAKREGVERPASVGSLTGKTTEEPVAPNLKALTPVGIAILAAFGLLMAITFRQAIVLSAGHGTTNPFMEAIAVVSLLAIPFVLSFFPLYAAVRGVKVYEEFVEGAKEGFPTALRIVPFLATMLVAIGMFRGSGGMDLLTHSLRHILDPIGFPSDLVPMVILRPLSGSGTLALFTDLVTRFGPDSLIARTAGTIFGSTETTFYVIAVYFGSVAVRRTRHAIAAGLIADATGVVVSIIVCRFMFGHG